jgi:hypothetical protein
MKFEVAIEIDGEFASVAGLFAPVVDIRENSSFPAVSGKQTRGELTFSYITDGACPIFRHLKEHPEPHIINYQLSYSIPGVPVSTLTGIGLQLTTNKNTGLHTLALKMPHSCLL